MRKLVLVLSLLLGFVIPTKAQYPSSVVNSDLLKDAYAVVRESKEEFIQIDASNGTYKVMYAITILNKNGDDYANFFTYEDNFRELKSFSGEIFDAAGKSIKKIAKKDLTTTAYSAELASSEKRTFYNVYSPSYPFTIKYTYELKYKNGILMYPTFVPQPGYHVSVESADYRLQLPMDRQLREKRVSIDVVSDKSEEKNNQVYNWSVSDLPAISYERFAPRNELIPIIYLSPAEFCVEKACGNMDTWENFGTWERELLKGRNTLPQASIDKIKELTEGITDPREKIKTLYEYLQKTTYYVSIQLGIGGWQPMPAEEVARIGFGDCKALSNYMKAMLDAIGIPSYYTSISTNKKRFFPDYPNFSQANHVILMVPMEQDSIWLECTSQSLPFGYIHSNILGHDALCVGDNDAFFYTLPNYSPLDNQEINRVEVRLSPEGHAEIETHSTYKMDIFERMHFKMKGLNSREENNFVGGLLQVSKPQVSNIRKEEKLTSRPEMDLFYSVQCEDYVAKTGSRMFFPVNPAYSSLKGYITGNSRKHDIVLESSIYKADTIKLYIPDGYEIESLPKASEINSEYGNFKTEIVQDGKELTYIQILQIVPGRYPASEFDQIKAFYNQIETLQTSRIGLKSN